MLVVYQERTTNTNAAIQNNASFSTRFERIRTPNKIVEPARL